VGATDVADVVPPRAAAALQGVTKRLRTINKKLGRKSEDLLSGLGKCAVRLPPNDA
jgi:hypothetical protein